jgi:hypothetical protein
VKEDDRGSQGHTSASLLHQSVMWHHAVNMHCFYTSCFITSAIAEKSSRVFVSNFAWTLLNPLPKHLKSFVRLLEYISGFELHSCFKGRSSVIWRRWTFWVTKQQQNDRKCWKNLRIHPWRPSPNDPWARRHRWDQLWSLPGDLNRKFEYVPHCCEVCSPTLDKWSKAAACKCVLSYEIRLTRNQLLSLRS